jgi:hypothetical protein
MLSEPEMSCYGQNRQMKPTNMLTKLMFNLFKRIILELHISAGVVHDTITCMALDRTGSNFHRRSQHFSEQDENGYAKMQDFNHATSLDLFS